ncbi:hypothetical protein [Psychrobacter halodurans]|uniref:Uncharacterized protein n=1 Tax=Psychrobacter halodurans TaxID=2818439 RepID=A0AAW4INU2_9GAMM|nr:hypothetical protein [Psychrobacter halodurans]MBO1517143.1 hypothetical protein [Psychrobacter halodurans]
MQFRQKSKLACSMALGLLCVGISACQPPAADNTPLEDTAADAPTTESPNAPVPTTTDTPKLTEAKTPKALTKALVALSEETLKQQLICTKLHGTINAIDHKSQAESIYTVQRQIQTCLPSANNTEVLQLLIEYQAMYQRFLQFNPPTDSAAFFTVMNAVERGEKITVAQLKQVPPRVRYLIGLVMGRSDIEVRYIGAGNFEFYHNLTTMAEIFTPYLPDDQRDFIQRMAQDNQHKLWFDAAITIPFDTVVERAVFWEEFMTRYPDSYFYDDAKRLFTLYRYLLFFGSERTRWTDDEIRTLTQSANNRLLQQLASRPNSQLAKDAQTFLAFMQQTASERQQSYPIPASSERGGDDTNKDNIARYQLSRALHLALPQSVDSKDCLTGIVCIDAQAAA